MSDLENLEIGFENCEAMSLSAEDVASVNLEQITDNLFKVWSSDKIKTSKTAETSIIVLPPTANKEYEGKTIFKRICEHNDITDFVIKDTAGNVECVTTKWNEDNTFWNNYQSTAFLSDGSLVVVVSKEKNAYNVKLEIDEKIKQIDEVRKMIKKGAQ